MTEREREREREIRNVILLGRWGLGKTVGIGPGHFLI